MSQSLVNINSHLKRFEKFINSLHTTESKNCINAGRHTYPNSVSGQSCRAGFQEEHLLSSRRFKMRRFSKYLEKNTAINDYDIQHFQNKLNHGVKT